MNATFLSLIWVSGLVIGYAIGRFEVARLAKLRQRGWIGEGPVLTNPDKPGELYDPETGHVVNFDRLSDLPPRH